MQDIKIRIDREYGANSSKIKVLEGEILNEQRNINRKAELENLIPVKQSNIESIAYRLAETEKQTAADTSSYKEKKEQYEREKDKLEFSSKKSALEKQKSLKTT